MGISEPALLHAERAFEDAALGLVEWDVAVRVFASALNTRSGQLCGLGTQAALPFNVMTGMDDAAATEFEAVGGADPWVNSRIRMGVPAPELALLDDAVFTPEQDRERAPEFGDWIDRHEVGYSCLANIIKRDDLVVGAAMLRDQSQDPMVDEEKRAFRRLLGSLRQSIRMQLAMEGHQARLVAGSFDSIDAYAFVCDADGRVLGMSLKAESLAEDGRWIAIQNGRLVATDTASRRRLSHLLARVSFGETPDAVVVRDAGGLPLYLEICRFRGSHALSFQAAALVIARPARRRTERLASLASAMWRLTATEALVAAYVSDGNAPQKIADLCGVSVGTVRTHLKRIFDKTGARSQVELSALLSAYL